MNKKMKVIEFIEQNSIQDLIDIYKINVKEYENYWVLNYDQIESQTYKFDQIVKDCRALILDKSTLTPLARSFERFYNLTEDPQFIQHKDKYFDITKAWCYEKVDGSLINLWWNPYNNCWQFSTRGMAHAEGPTPGRDSKLTFKDVIEDAVTKHIPQDVLKFINSGCFNTITDYIFSSLDKDYTYMCELVSPMTRIVKPYKEVQLYYLAHKHNITGEEYISLNKTNLNLYANIFKKPEVYRFDTLDALTESINNLPFLDEGYVCCWEDPDTPRKINRLKVKDPRYLAVANMRMNGVISEKRAAYIVMMNNEAEHLAYYPEDMYAFKDFIEARDILLKDVPIMFKNLKEKYPTQKEFAIALNNMKCGFFGLLFNMYKGLSFEDSVKLCIYGKNQNNKEKSGIEKETVTDGSMVLLEHVGNYYKRLYINQIIEILKNRC